MPHRARHLVTFTTTVLFLICASSARAQCTDDDNDGWTTCNGDCDDTNAAISPADKEKCDGVDNDCDGDIDEGFDVDGNGIGDCLEACPMLLDFDSDPDGLPIYAGADLTEAYADWGIHVDVYYPNGVDPSLGIAFDSSDPSGGDFDLGTPNEDFGGPGIGDGGGLGEAGENALDLFNLLIVAENTTDADGDGLVDTPDDNAVGGWFEFTFDGETCVESLDLVDIEASEAPTDILLYDASGALITTVAAGGLGGNSVEQVTVQECGVRDMVIHFSGSGGVDNIALCVGAVLEICDGIDNDGDGMVDEGYDDDHDGWTTCEGDCNDNDASINPDAAEQCNFVDDDCDGLLMADEVDVDGDGVMACAGDCDDHDADVFPGAVEICNGLDDDCGGDIDEGFDADGDGVTVCGGDCDDGDGSVFPGAPELCDGVDGDCDGALAADEVDADGDGAMVCDGDCDDADPSVYPGATDICDNVDNDCDGIIPASEVDGDGDGYAECEGDCNDFDADVNPGAAEQCNGADDDCDGAVPADEADGDGDGYLACDADCDDANADTWPGAAELCDGEDNDCDGDVPLLETVDLDGDGYLYCEDCDEATADTYPGAPEICDGEDNDCDGDVDEGIGNDLDGDGHTDCSGDCDDTDADVYPGATELCNYGDDDCNGINDDGFLVGGQYVDVAHCGACGNDCAAYGFVNADPYCDTTPAVPECAPTCWAGFYDANGNPDDGCECEVIGGVDEPFDGLDHDCDGADGDHGDAIHVSTTGDPAGTGAIGDPLDSIQDGVDEAVLQGLAWVLVAEGTYVESVELASGVTMVGGWPDDFAYQDADAYPTTVNGLAATADVPGTFTLRCAAGDTQRIQGFSLLGTTPAADGDSSYGVYLEDCDEGTVVTDNDIQSRSGADGTAGGDGGDGVIGSDGAGGEDADWTDCSPGPYGGGGGAQLCDVQDVSGGAGGDTTCPMAAGDWQPSGADGLGDTPGAGGVGGVNGSYDWYLLCLVCDWDANSGPGDAGDDGGDGGAGPGGDGGSATGTVAAGLYIGASGDVGDTGSHGAGGGGGGSGTGADYDCDYDDIAGGTGGGGGSGGCGAAGGAGGTGGGGSFGLLLHYTTTPATYPELVDNAITSLAGGDGGPGGTGGIGGEGGFGGTGGDSMADWTCALEGGDGGTGGDGGHGGGGGGGCGGPSYAIAVWGAIPDPTYGDGNTLSTGSGGDGGDGGDGPGGTDGGVGAIGEAGERNY